MTIEGHTYETFVNHAHGGSGKASMRNGAYHWILDSLILAEKNAVSSWKLPSREKQAARIRKYLGKALDGYANQSVDPHIKSVLLDLKADLQSAKRSKDFIGIISQAKNIIGD